MADYKEAIERTEDGGFIVQLLDEDGALVAEGQGASYEEAQQDAQSKI